jgi:hypothetical protein
MQEPRILGGSQIGGEPKGAREANARGAKILANAIESDIRMSKKNFSWYTWIAKKALHINAHRGGVGREL